MSLADFVRRLFTRPNPPPTVDADAVRSTDEIAARWQDESVTRWRKALSDFAYPHTLVSPQQIEEALRAEHTAGKQLGFTAVAIVPGLWNSTGMSAEKRAKKALNLITEYGASYDASYGRQLLAGKFDCLYDDLEFDAGCPNPALFDMLRPAKPTPLKTGLQLLRRHNVSARTIEPVPQVAIMRIPTAESHTIPVYLDWGGWNAVPSPLEICAISRHWGEAYGARLTVIGSDQLEFRVARKPADHATAVALLKEHFCFAPENWEFDQGVLEKAAAQLQVSESWIFWWD